MKAFILKLITVLGLAIPVISSSQSKYKDASLKTDVSKLDSACECNDAIIKIMKEQIQIQEDLLSKKHSHKDSLRIDTEYKKRNSKFYEVYKQCMPIYKEGGMTKCDNSKEAEKLDSKLNDLRKKTGMN